MPNQPNPSPACHPSYLEQLGGPRTTIFYQPYLLTDSWGRQKRYYPVGRPCRPARPNTGTWPRLLLSRWGTPGHRPWVLINRTHGPGTPGLHYGSRA